VSDIVKGVLGGGWSLLLGWIFPAAINLLILRFLVLPQLDNSQIVRWLEHSDSEQQGLTLLVGATTLGIILAAIQTPLYRLLEGYIGWEPPRSAGARGLRSPFGVLLQWSRDRQLRRKQVLRRRVELIELSPLEKTGSLRNELRVRLKEARADIRLERYRRRDAKRGAAQLGLLREQLQRYPVDDIQVVPTRLGNAIRRLEEYGYDRYRLDSQIFWYHLNTVASEYARKQVDQARTTLDFLVSLLYGHVFVAILTAIGIWGTGTHDLALLTIVAALLTAAWIWYNISVIATDDWAAAVRSLVDLGRRPLAEALSLSMPMTLASERDMWARASRLAARPYDARSAELDQHRRGQANPTEAATKSED
jgi:hypothetical protein